MAAKRKSAAKTRAPPMSVEGRTSCSLFNDTDIPKLATAAALPLASTDHRELARQLHAAFIWSHTQTYMASNKPGMAELRDGFSGVAAAGRELLLALGIEVEPTKLLSESRSNILEHSSVLRALINYAPPDTCELLHRDMVEAWACSYPMSPARRREYAAKHQIFESARTVAYLVAVADATIAALPKPTTRGPWIKVFTPVLLDKLVKCHAEMFGRWPTVTRTEGDTRGGAALTWLQNVLVLARGPPTIGRL